MLLVTGAGGMLGRTVLREARAQGRDVRASLRKPLPDVIAGVDMCIGDLRDAHTLAACVDGVVDVIHLAAARTDTKEQDIYDDVPLAGRLLDHWRGGAFVFASSQIVYDVTRGKSALSEEAPCAPPNWYATGKLMIEQMVATQARLNAAAGQSGRHASLRIPLIAFETPSRSPQVLDTIVPALIGGLDIYFAAQEEEARGWGSSWVGAGDLARALLAAIQAPVAGVYNIASGWFSYVELVERLIRLTGSRSRLRFGAQGQVNIPPYGCRLDTGRIETAGFRPADNLYDIIDQYLIAAHAVQTPASVVLPAAELDAKFAFDD